MTRLVDASVAVKWVASEPDSDRALELLRGELAAPDLILAELANILWKKVRRQELSFAQAAAGLVQVQAKLDVLPATGLYPRVLEIAVELDHPAYDCIYLALAETLDVRLVTADVRLVRRCADTRFARLIEPLA